MHFIGVSSSILTSFKLSETFEALRIPKKKKKNSEIARRHGQVSGLG